MSGERMGDEEFNSHRFAGGLVYSEAQRARASEAALREQWRKSESEWREEAKNSLATIATLREENERLRRALEQLDRDLKSSAGLPMRYVMGIVDAALSKEPTR